MSDDKGIRQAAGRHIREMRGKGETPTVEKVTKKITKSAGFKVIWLLAGFRKEDVEKIVEGILKQA